MGIQKLIQFEDIDQKFKIGGGSEYSLSIPTSKACFLILWLYSIEPPFYCHLNTACRLMDATLLPMLGPFASALYHILLLAEGERSDKLYIGKDLHAPHYNKHHPLGCFSCSFLVFRGVSLSPSIIQRWTKMHGKSEYDHRIDQGQKSGEMKKNDWDEEPTPDSYW